MREAARVVRAAGPRAPHIEARTGRRTHRRARGSAKRRGVLGAVRVNVSRGVRAGGTVEVDGASDVVVRHLVE